MTQMLFLINAILRENKKPYVFIFIVVDLILGRPGGHWARGGWELLDCGHDSAANALLSVGLSTDLSAVTTFPK